MSNRSLRMLKGVAALAGIGLLLALTWPRDEHRSDFKSGTKSGEHLLLYCAAGLRDPVQTIITDYQHTYGVTIDVQYGGSGTLLSSLKVSQRGDLYLAADAHHMDMAVQGGLAVETIPIARQHLVLVTRAGNPRAIRELKDLTRLDVRAAYANPEVASAGKTIQSVMEKMSLWETAKRQAAVFKPTVNDVANDVVLGSADVGAVWNPLVALYPGLEAIHTQELDAQSEQIRIGVLASSKQTKQALHFSRYLSARDRGLAVFQRSGYLIERGDQWAEVPTLTLFSGDLNRVAIQETLRDFEQREGCTVRVVYNGCGILLAQMKAIPEGAEGSAFPDAFLAGDVSSFDPLKDRFGERTLLSETEVVILVPKANPHGLQTLKDLMRPGLKLGIGNAEQSTLGTLTDRILKAQGIAEEVQKNVRSQTPTADMLVTQIQAGSLDAVVVYSAHAKAVLADFTALPIDLPEARAIQPYAVAKAAMHAQLAQRLLQRLNASESRARYKSAGFRWHTP